jgi:hypothetical protein
MNNLTPIKLETAELLKLIHRGHARLKSLPKETDRYASLKDMLDCAVSIMALNIRNEVFIPKPHQNKLIAALRDAVRITVEIK